MPKRGQRGPSLVGQRFDRLVVVAYIGPTRTRHSLWACDCDCGGKATVAQPNLLNGQAGSCGCRAKDRAREAQTTHGGCGTVEYRIWLGIRKRCSNPNCRQFFYWGGRGITVCDRWANSFADFLADVGPRLSPKHSIDRYPDNNGNYEPGNVRWATAREQRLNQRRMVE